MRSNTRPQAAIALSLAELGERLGAELIGDGEVTITGAAGLGDALPGDLVRVDASRHLPAALASPAAALLVGPDSDSGGLPALRVPDPRAGFARVLELFYPESR